MTENDLLDEDTPLLERTDTGENAIEIPPVIGHGYYAKLFPFGFLYELKMLSRLAAPIACTSLINYSFGPISVMFCGHLGSFDLATVGLAISVFNVTGLAVAMGMLTACDTLFSQVYGSSNFQNMGLNLQRSLILMGLCCIPCWSLHLVVEPLLLLLKQNPLIAKRATLYLTYMIPCLAFAAAGQIFTKYVQAQNQVVPAFLIGGFSNLINAILHYLFLFVLKTGIKGSAFAQLIAYFTQTVLFVVYTKWHPMSDTTWINYRKAILDDWGLWFRLAVPGLFMVTMEWTIFEIGSLVAGVLGEQELGAQTIIYNIESLFYTLLPLGIGVAASIRVGHFLGAKCPVGPRSVTSVSIITVCLLVMPMIVLFIALRFQIPHIFTHDEKVIEIAAKLLPILAIFQLSDGIVGVCSGIIRGAGMQYVGAVICFITLYVVGAPMGIGMIFGSGYGIDGLWWGLCMGVMLSACIYLVTCSRLNWEKQVQLAIERVNPNRLELPRPSTNGDEGDPEIPVSSVQKRHGFHRIYNLSPPMICSQTEEVAGMDTAEDRQPSRGKLFYLSRITLIFVLGSIFITCLICRLLLNWSDYFGFYCVYKNSTFINFQTETELAQFLNTTSLDSNCTVVIP